MKELQVSKRKSAGCCEGAYEAPQETEELGKVPRNKSVMTCEGGVGASSCGRGGKQVGCSRQTEGRWRGLELRERGHVQGMERNSG